jgi:hypothetical protein
MMTALAAAAAILAVGLLLLRFNGAWIYRVWDRATRNPTGQLPAGYELPRYFRETAKGDIDVTTRWPGWDGWYFFLLPDDRTLPVRMVRASVMTGLYGLDGIDNYERLKFRLDTFEAVECLSLIPTVMRTPGGFEMRNNLSQHYLPRRWHLYMKPQVLDVAVTGQQAERDEAYEEYGRVQGSWPYYRMHFLNPEGGIEVDLNFTAERVIWWADAPGLFTYFSVLGNYDGRVRLLGGSAKPDAHQIPAAEESYAVTGSGAFEHGFARKLFSADRAFLPVRLFNYLAPSFRPIRYHYEMFLAEEGGRGGFMHARAFGIPVRDRGGFFFEGTYVAIGGVRVEYLEDPPPDLVAANCPGRPPVTFYRKWRVRAATESGELVYTAAREFPPASAAANMMYYHFVFEGTYRGKRLAGRGYGEYVHI